MNNDMIIYLSIGAIIGFIIGLVLINIISPTARKYAKVKRELEETREKLNAQQQIIVKHFSHSAEILDNMARDFRRLHQNMVENSSQLAINSEDPPAIYLNSNDNDLNSIKELHLEKQPKDYSGNPSGLLKTEENKA